MSKKHRSGYDSICRESKGDANAQDCNALPLVCVPRLNFRGLAVEHEVGQASNESSADDL